MLLIQNLNANITDNSLIERGVDLPQLCVLTQDEQTHACALLSNLNPVVL